MPGYMLHQGATLLCMHSGSAQPIMPDPRVKVSGQQIATQTCQYLVSGCTLSGTSSTVWCVSAQWITAATRVKASGSPVLLQDSQAVCTTTGTPLNIVVTQMRVKAT